MSMDSESGYNRLDFAFAHFLGRCSTLQGEPRDAFVKLVAKLSAQQGSGHSCMTVDDGDKALLRSSGMVAAAGKAPLVLEQDRLYSHRYWFYERRLADQVLGLCAQRYSYPDLERHLGRFFESAEDSVDWQREAARIAVTQGFSIVTGGPGTGKTTTVVKILALLQELAPTPLHMALAAPTGKAAMRLQESIGVNKAVLPCGEAVMVAIPERVTTIHRLLGARPPSPYFLHSAEAPLPYDVVVVDEASMVDLALMSKLVDALKPGARLILLGDKDQLASVESGAVLADLTSGLSSHTLELRKSHRFQGGIKALADAVNRQQAETAWDLLRRAEDGVTLLSGDMLATIAGRYRQYLRMMAEGADLPSVFAAFNAFQVLCANRSGPRSVLDINMRTEQRLAEQGLIRPRGQWYAGRPVMVTENNAAMQLYNGDIGLCLSDASRGGKLMAFFPRPDGSVKKVLPGRMPSCVSVFAMTIHKSQGSEFGEVMIVLPESPNPVLSKELLYTAVTRARDRVEVVAEEAVFAACVRQKVERNSGLAEKLAESRVLGN